MTSDTRDAWRGWGRSSCPALGQPLRLLPIGAFALRVLRGCWGQNKGGWVFDALRRSCSVPRCQLPKPWRNVILWGWNRGDVGGTHFFGIVADCRFIQLLLRLKNKTKHCSPSICVQSKLYVQCLSKGRVYNRPMHPWAPSWPHDLLHTEAEDWWLLIWRRWWNPGLIPRL